MGGRLFRSTDARAARRGGRAPGTSVRVERLQNLIARLHALPRRRLTLLVGVDGRAGSGKTTFTRALAALDPGLDVIEIADFVPPAAEQMRQSDEVPPVRVAADVDWRRLRSTLLLPLSRDQAARYQRYDPTNGDEAPLGHRVGCRIVALVSGRYSCMKALSMFYD